MNEEYGLQKAAQLWQTGLPRESKSGSKSTHWKSIHWMNYLPMLQQNRNKLVNWFSYEFIIWQIDVGKLVNS